MPFNETQVRNVSGQVRRKPVRDALVGLLSRDATDKLEDEPRTIAQRLAMALITEALAGDKDARKEVIDRTDGKPPQSIIGGEDDEPPIRTVHELPQSDKDIINRYLAEKDKK